MIERRLSSAACGPVAVVAHDAGGAEVVSSLIRESRVSYLVSVEGPARAIFARKLSSAEPVRLSEAIERAEWLLCATSWQSDLELDAIKMARRAAKPVAALLDHWVNYRERFTRHGEITLPDEIWVCDEHAERLAQASFVTPPVVRVENPHLAEVVAEIRAAPPAARRGGVTPVLYVSEPISEHAARWYGDARYWGYTEDEALRFFLSSLPALNCQNAQIVLRPHPSETSAKYAWAVAESPVPLVIDGGPPLTQQIADCDLVVGCRSMAMVIGLLAGRRVVNCVPPGGGGFGLPHPEIESLQAAVRRRDGVGAP